MTRPDQFYTGLVAQMYSLLRAERFDPAQYAAFVRRGGEPALELGCGDGEPILDLIAAGLHVEGLDSSLDMLARCRVAADARGLEVQLHHGLIETMDLDRVFRSIYLAGATFNLLADDDAAARGLDRVAAHLQPGGAALIPLFIPDATPVGRFGQPREHANADGSVMRVTVLSADRDEAARTQSSLLRYEVLVDGEVADDVERSWLLHWHTQDGFRALAEAAGLQVLAVRSGDGSPAMPDADSFTFLLRRLPVHATPRP